MERVERPERNRVETGQKSTSAYGVPILQGMHLEKSLRYIVFEGCYRSALRAGIDVSVPAAAAQKATQLDHSEAADRY